MLHQFLLDLSPKSKELGAHETTYLQFTRKTKQKGKMQIITIINFDLDMDIILNFQIL